MEEKCSNCRIDNVMCTDVKLYETIQDVWFKSVDQVTLDGSKDVWFKSVDQVTLDGSILTTKFIQVQIGKQYLCTGKFTVFS